MRLGIVLMSVGVSMASAGTAGAKDDVAMVYVTGIGRSSCASWMSDPRLKGEGEVWIYGFWTAANYSAAVNRLNQRADMAIDSAGIVGEVRKTCNERPSQNLADAAWKTFLEITKK